MGSSRRLVARIRTCCVSPREFMHPTGPSIARHREAQDAAGVFCRHAGAMTEHHRSNGRVVCRQVEPITELHTNAGKRPGANLTAHRGWRRRRRRFSQAIPTAATRMTRYPRVHFHRSVTRHAPRPCVNANNCFCPAGVRISESHIVTAGPNPVSSVIHVWPPSIDTITPRSVPR